MHRIIVAIILLAFSTLLAQSLEITDFQRLDSDMTARVTAPKMDNYGKPMALLKISTALTGVSVTGSGYIDVETRIGEIWAYVSEGTFRIRLAVEGYERLTYNLPETAQSAVVYSMTLRGEKIADQVPVMFDTDPSVAEIFIDGNSVGRTQNGKLSTTTGAGSHAVRIVLDGFETVEEEQDIQIGNQAFGYKLVEAMDARVTIQSDPEGAQVYIKNVFFGETPVTGFFPEGSFDIRIEKDCYRTIEEKITITDPTTKNYSLTDIRATLTINTHPNATVYINDDAGHKGGVIDLKLKPQMANIRVEMPKSDTITRSVLLEEGQTVTKDLYPEVQTGIVMVNVIPADATIELTGDAGEHYTSTGKNTFRDVPVGTYELKVAADGHKTHKETLTLTADETVRKQMKLEEDNNYESYSNQIENQSENRDVKPFVGITMSVPKASDIEKMGVTDGSGLLLTSIIDDSSADKAGLQKGDILLQIDGKNIYSSVQSADIISNMKIGQETEFLIFRNGERKTFGVIIGSKIDIKNQSENRDIKPFVGITMSVPKASDIEKMGVTDGSGLLLTSIIDDSSADKAGLQKGDILLQIDGRNIYSSVQVTDIISNMKIGQETEFLIFRNGERKTFGITIGSK